MNPILITTPRTGSTLISDLLFNLHKDKYKTNLWEFFSVDSITKNTYGFKNGNLQRLSHERPYKQWWSTSQREIRLQRLEMLKSDQKNMIKIMAHGTEPEILDFVKSNYDIIFLERKNKIQQFLSWTTMVQHRKRHYGVEEVDSIESIQYDPEHTTQFIKIIQPYFKIKKEITGKIIYYEDFIENGANEAALIKLLNLPIIDYKPMVIETKPTPYKDEIEKIILNKEEWFSNKEKIELEIENLSTYE